MIKTPIKNYSFVCVCVYTCMCARACIYMYLAAHMCRHIHTHISTCAGCTHVLHTFGCTHVQAYTHTHQHMCRHTHTHISTHISRIMSESPSSSSWHPSPTATVRHVVLLKLCNTTFKQQIHQQWISCLLRYYKKLMLSSEALTRNMLLYWGISWWWKVIWLGKIDYERYSLNNCVNQSM